MLAAFLSVACAMPLSHMNNANDINTISIKHSGPAVAAVCEAVAVDTVFFKTPSPPQCDLKDDPICDLSLRNHDEQWYKILDVGQQAYLRNLNAADFTPEDVRPPGHNTVKAIKMVIDWACRAARVTGHLLFGAAALSVKDQLMEYGSATLILTAQSAVDGGLERRHRHTVSVFDDCGVGLFEAKECFN